MSIEESFALFSPAPKTPLQERRRYDRCDHHMMRMAEKVASSRIRSPLTARAKNMRHKPDTDKQGARQKYYGGADQIANRSN